MARPAVRITHSCGPVPEASRPAAISTSVITPIVFWPSDVPWASATIDAVNACPYLNPVAVCALGVFLVMP